MIRDLRDLRKLSLLFSLTISVNSSNLEDILSKNRVDLIEAPKEKVKPRLRDWRTLGLIPLRVEVLLRA